MESRMYALKEADIVVEAVRTSQTVIVDAYLFQLLHIYIGCFGQSCQREGTFPQVSDYANLKEVGNKLLGEIKDDFSSTCIHITHVVILHLCPLSWICDSTIDCHFMLDSSLFEMDE